MRRSSSYGPTVAFRLRKSAGVLASARIRSSAELIDSVSRRGHRPSSDMRHQRDIRTHKRYAIRGPRVRRCRWTRSCQIRSRCLSRRCLSRRSLSRRKRPNPSYPWIGFGGCAAGRSVIREHPASRSAEKRHSRESRTARSTASVPTSGARQYAPIRLLYKINAVARGCRQPPGTDQAELPTRFACCFGQPPAIFGISQISLSGLSGA